MELEKRADIFLKLVQRNDFEGVKTFISDSARSGLSFNVNALYRSKSGDSALHVASRMVHLEMLRYSPAIYYAAVIGLCPNILEFSSSFSILIRLDF